MIAAIKMSDVVAVWRLGCEISQLSYANARVGKAVTMRKMLVDNGRYLRGKDGKQHRVPKGYHGNNKVVVVDQDR